LIRWRCFARDYEKRTDVSHAMTFVAMGDNMLRRTLIPDVFKGFLMVWKQ
jgi:hypothetical protein